ncbi:MAG TPA: hypothetical protein VMZ92_05000 [Planctomycetota bacterium]|nr:hypothetical protein [Planctomycetota bacterium]
MSNQRETVEGLLRVIGEGRSTHTPEEVADAESKLREMAGDVEELKAFRRDFETREREKREATLRDGGTLAIIFGVVLLAAFAAVLSAPYWGPSTRRDIFDNYPMIVFTWICAIYGPALLIGGIGLKTRTEMGRKVMIGVCWFGFAAALAMAVAFSVHLRGVRRWADPRYEPEPVPFLIAVGLPFFMFSMLLNVFRGVVRFLSSDEVKALCGGTPVQKTGPEDSGPGGFWSG